MITIDNIKYCYQNFKTNYKNLTGYDLGRHLGYLEASLLQYGYLETEYVNGEHEIRRKVIRKKTWLRKEKKETLTDALIRMTETLLKDV